jgi:hypothetical protein
MKTKAAICMLALVALMMPGVLGEHISLKGYSPQEFSARATISFDINGNKAISGGNFYLNKVCSDTDHIWLDGGDLSFSGSNPLSCYFSGETLKCKGANIPISGSLRMSYDPYYGIVVRLTDTSNNWRDWYFPTKSNPFK